MLFFNFNAILTFNHQNSYILCSIIELMCIKMTINDLNKCKQTILENFRGIKLEKDHAKLQLLLFQLSDLINHYEKLISLHDEIQSKHYQTIKHMEEEEILSDFDYISWHQQRTSEVTAWKHELQILGEYKHHIENIIKQIEDGTVEQSLIEEEKVLSGTGTN